HEEHLVLARQLRDRGSRAVARGDVRAVLHDRGEVTQRDDVALDLRQHARGGQLVGSPEGGDDDRATHRAPFVDGTPDDRGSGSTAARRARATALNCASAMWWGSRPASRRRCMVRPAWKASDSSACPVIDPVKWPPIRWYRWASDSPS